MLRKLFNIFPGEERAVLLFAALGLFWSYGINLGLKYSDALLLMNVGAQALPLIYIISACGMIVPAIFLLNYINKIPSHRIFLSVIALAIIFYGAIFLLYRQKIGINTPYFWYILRFVSFQLDTLLITSFWTFVDQYHNMQDAKRLFVLYSLMVFIGQAAVGLTISLGIIPYEYTLLIIIASMLFGSFLILYIKDTLHIAHDLSAEESSLSIKSISVLDSLKAIAKSRFALMVIFNNFVIFLMWVTLEFNYLSYFDQTFDPPGTHVAYGNEEDAAITLLIGKLLLGVSVTNLIFGLFLYSRLVRRFGVGAMLFFTPSIVIFNMIGWISYQALIFPVIGYFVVEGFLEVVDDSNFNLLLNAVSKRIKYRVRIIIESFMEPMAMLISGLLLTSPLINPKYLCLSLSIIACGSAYLIRKNYHRSVYQNLAANAIHFERKLNDWFARIPASIKKAEIKKLLILVDSPSQVEQDMGLEGLLSCADEELLMLVIEKARQLAPESKIIFIYKLSKSRFAYNQIIAKSISLWLNDSINTKLKATILIYLAEQGLLPPTQHKEDLSSQDLERRVAAIMSLLTYWGNLPPSTVMHNKKIAAIEIEKLISSSCEKEVCAGLRILGHEYSHNNILYLLPYLNSSFRAIARRSMKSIAQISNKQCRKYAKILINHLRVSKDSVFRFHCLSALGKLDEPTLIRDIVCSSLHFFPFEKRLVETIAVRMGVKTVPILLSVTKNPKIPERCRALSGKILGRLALPHLQANLKEIIEKEVDRAYFYFYHFSSIQSQYPEHDLTLLVEALHSGFHSVMDFIIQLLSAAGEVEDCDLILRLFRSHGIKIRSQVVEMLEKTCDRKIMQSLRPLIEETPTTEILSLYINSQKYILSLEELLKTMSLSSSQVDQIAAATLMQRLNISNWRAIIKKQMLRQDDLFKHFANELLHSSAHSS